jgi:hypothetical protein
MNPDHIQASAARDQLWASLRALHPDLQGLAEGAFDGSERQRQIVQLMAKIICAELDFRAEETKE